MVDVDTVEAGADAMVEATASNCWNASTRAYADLTGDERITRGRVHSLQKSVKCVWLQPFVDRVMT